MFLIPALVASRRNIQEVTHGTTGTVANEDLRTSSLCADELRPPVDIGKKASNVTSAVRQTGAVTTVAEDAQHGGELSGRRANEKRPLGADFRSHKYMYLLYLLLILQRAEV